MYMHYSGEVGVIKYTPFFCSSNRRAYDDDNGADNDIDGGWHHDHRGELQDLHEGGGGGG